MTDGPRQLDEHHPRIAPTIEILSQRTFNTPDHLGLVEQVKVVHESVSMRKDSSRPFGPSNRLPPSGLMIAGPTFVGKSYAVEKAIKELRPVQTADGQLIRPKVLSFQCSPNANVASFLNDLLRNIGYPLNRDLPAGHAATRIANQIALQQYTLLHIDEFEWAAKPAASPGRSRADDENLIWNVIHSIASQTEWPTPIVLSGLPTILTSLNLLTDERAALRSRFDVTAVDSLSLKNAGDAEDIVRILCDDISAKFAIDSEINLGKRLVHASNYALGIVLRLAKLAIARAVLRTDRTLRIDDFVSAYATKTSCRPAANPFATADWRSVDPTLVWAQTADQRRPEKQVA